MNERRPTFLSIYSYVEHLLNRLVAVLYTIGPSGRAVATETIPYQNEHVNTILVLLSELLLQSINQHLLAKQHRELILNRCNVQVILGDVRLHAYRLDINI